MVTAAKDERARLAALSDLAVMDMPPDMELDRLVKTVGSLFDAPVCFIALLDEHRQWFRSQMGLDMSETPRSHSFCTHAIQGNEVLVVDDARADPRFVDNPFVSKAGGLRFYAGAPLKTSGGHNVGTLCIMDVKTRTFSDRQRQQLFDIAQIVIGYLEARAVTGKTLEAYQVRVAKLQVLHNLIGGLTHDFNNLLNIAVHNLSLLRMELKDSDDACKRIDTSTDILMRGGALTKQLINLARRPAGREDVIDVGASVRNVQDLLTRSLLHGITPEMRLPEDPCPTAVDPSDLEDAILNLVLNARDAMDKDGSLVIEVARDTVAEDNEAPRDFIVISVADSGCGIPNELIETVFEPNVTTKGDDGFGLGLTMVRDFAQRSGGHVRISSVVGTGTTVRLCIPAASDESAIVTMPDERDRDGGRFQPARRRGATILIVDDEPELLEIAEESLTIVGYRVLTARSAAEAIDILRGAAEIDLLFSDVIMPGDLDGVALGEAAQQLKPEIRVLLTSGYAGQLEQDDPDHKLLRNLLRKPYDPDTMLAAIDRALDDAAN